MAYRVSIQINSQTDKVKEISKRVAEIIQAFSGKYPKVQISNKRKK